MLNNCYKCAKAISAKGPPFPVEPVIMDLLFSQHKLTKWLEGQISKGKTNVLNPLDQSLNEISHIISSTVDRICSADFNSSCWRANIFQSVIDSSFLSNASISSFRCKILIRILS
jgi:hypothetical protein